MALVLVASGCHPSTGPCVDGYLGCGPVTTPSREHALAAEREPRLARRPFAEDVAAPRDGSVSHGPLFFEDAPGDTVGDDGCFAWSGDDYLIGSFTGFRFLANLALFPISAIDTPPWRLMDSDGRPSRQVICVWHDAAKRCDAPSAPCQPQPCNAG